MNLTDDMKRVVDQVVRKGYRFKGTAIHVQQALPLVSPAYEQGHTEGRAGGGVAQLLAGARRK